MTSWQETFDGSSVDQPWTALRDQVAWSLPGGGVGAISNAGGNTYQRLDRDLGSTDHYAEALLPRTWADTANGDPRVVLLLRAASGTTQTYYAASLQLTNSVMSFLYWSNGSVVGGGPFGAVPNEPVAIPTDGPLAFRFEVEGSLFRAYLNGALVKAETDTQRTTGTLAGTGGQRPSTIRWAQFRAGALGDGVGEPGRQLLAA